MNLATRLGPVSASTRLKNNRPPLFSSNSASTVSPDARPSHWRIFDGGFDSRRFRVPEIVLGIGLGIIVSLFAAGVGSYQTANCEKPQATESAKPEANNPYEASAAHGSEEGDKKKGEKAEHAISFSCGASGLFFAMVGFMDHHEGFFVGSFTLFLAVATIMLWRSTNDLWAADERQFRLSRRMAVRQSADTKASIAVAQEAAMAAKAGNLLNRDSFVAEQRPWVSFGPINLISGISYDANGATLTIRFVVKNTGRTPAAGMWINALISGTMMGNPTERAANFIAENKARQRVSWGHMLFPDDTFVQDITMTINADEIDVINNSEVKFLRPQILACIIYYFTFDPGIHLTCIDLEIYKKPGNIVIQSDGNPVPIEDLVLRHAVLATGYAD